MNFAAVMGAHKVEDRVASDEKQKEKEEEEEEEEESELEKPSAEQEEVRNTLQSQDLSLSQSPLHLACWRETHYLRHHRHIPRRRLH
jgi:hypothetical protein